MCVCIYAYYKYVYYKYVYACTIYVYNIYKHTLDISYETLHMKRNLKKRRIKSMRPSDGWYAGAL